MSLPHRAICYHPETPIYIINPLHLVLERTGGLNLRTVAYGRANSAAMISIGVKRLVGVKRLGTTAYRRTISETDRCRIPHQANLLYIGTLGSKALAHMNRFVQTVHPPHICFWVHASLLAQGRPLHKCRRTCPWRVHCLQLIRMHQR